MLPISAILVQQERVVVEWNVSTLAEFISGALSTTLSTKTLDLQHQNFNVSHQNSQTSGAKSATLRTKAETGSWRWEPLPG